MNARRFLLPASLLVLTTVAAAWLFAHPGHAPLPTTGVQVDTEAGVLTLSAAARSVLDLRTEEVTREELGREAFVARTWEWKRKYGILVEADVNVLVGHHRTQCLASDAEAPVGP